MIWDEGDANPLHRRIPGEVVARRARIPKKFVPEKEPDEVSVDLKAAVALKPEARLKWLTKACKMVTEGTASSTDLYDIVVNRKFVSGMPERVVRKISLLIQDSLSLFSDKQQRYLSSNECPIMARLVVREDPHAVEYAPEEGRDGTATFADAAVDMVEWKVGTPGPPPVPQTPMPMSRQMLPPGLSQAHQFLQQQAGSSGSDPNGSRWQAVKDEWAIRRQEAESKEQAKREAARRAEKERRQQAEEEAVARSVAEAEAERRRKLEEEADALFTQAVSSGPLVLATTDQRKRSRSLSRSRSISSRTARRLARANKTERAKNRGSWRQEPASSGALSGSRAIFMNRDFVEDLPHMPRPSTPGVQGVGGFSQRRQSSPEKSRRTSRSRTRSRRRR